MVPADLDLRLGELDAAVGAARTAMLRVGVEHCDVARLKTANDAVSMLRNTIDGFKADLSCRAEELRRGGNSRPVDDAMNPGGRGSPAVERGDRDRGDVFDKIPGLEDATKSGVLSGRYSDIVARAVKKLAPEVRAEFYRRHQDLADFAQAKSEHAFRLHVRQLVERVLYDCGVERAERQRRNRRVSIWEDLDDGMVCLRAAWDPETGARIHHAIDNEVSAIYHTRRDDSTDTRSRDQVVADAVANLLCGTPVSKQSGNSGAQVLVITDRRTATGNLHDGSVHEYGHGAPVAPATLRRIVADPDTEVRTVAVNDHGVVVAIGDAVLDEGRHQRFASPVQRLALRAMYRTCMIDGCDVPFGSCEMHHLIDWDNGGFTDLDNLGPLCVRHHHLLHREGWVLRLDPVTRQLTIIDPDGATAVHSFHGLAPPGNHDLGDLGDVCDGCARWLAHEHDRPRRGRGQTDLMQPRRVA